MLHFFYSLSRCRFFFSLFHSVVLNMWECCWNWFPNLHNWYTRSNSNNQAITFSCCIAKHLQNRLLKTWFKALSSFTIKKNNLYNYNRSSSLETLHILIYPPPIAKCRLNKLKYLSLSLSFTSFPSRCVIINHRLQFSSSLSFCSLHICLLKWWNSHYWLACQQ